MALSLNTRSEAMQRNRPRSITGPDKAIWFTEVGAGRIGRLTMQGAVRHFNAGPGRLSGVMTIAKDNALWFNKDTTVTRMTMRGARTECALQSGVFATGAIFGSSHGGIYLGAIKRSGVGAIVSLSPSGATHEYDLPQEYLLPDRIGPNGQGCRLDDGVELQTRSLAVNGLRVAVRSTPRQAGWSDNGTGAVATQSASATDRFDSPTTTTASSGASIRTRHWRKCRILENGHA